MSHRIKNEIDLNSNENSAVKLHTRELGLDHCFIFKNTEILDFESDHTKLEIKESFLIKKLDPSLNRNLSSRALHLS